MEAYKLRPGRNIVNNLRQHVEHLSLVNSQLRKMWRMAWHFKVVCAHLRGVRMFRVVRGVKDIY